MKQKSGSRMSKDEITQIRKGEYKSMLCELGHFNNEDLSIKYVPPVLHNLWQLNPVIYALESDTKPLDYHNLVNDICRLTTRGGKKKVDSDIVRHKLVRGLYKALNIQTFIPKIDVYNFKDIKIPNTNLRMNNLRMLLHSYKNHFIRDVHLSIFKS